VESQHSLASILHRLPASLVVEAFDRNVVVEVAAAVVRRMRLVNYSIAVRREQSIVLVAEECRRLGAQRHSVVRSGLKAPLGARMGSNAIPILDTGALEWEVKRAESLVGANYNIQSDQETRARKSYPDTPCAVVQCCGGAVVRWWKGKQIYIQKIFWNTRMGAWS
jgi:hypothetical protein